MSAGVRTEGARSLVYGLGVLRAFDSEHPVRSISELAQLIGVSRPTAHRYAVTFLELGYLEQAPMRRYRLAPRAAELGVAMVDSLAVTRRARPIVRRLRDATGASVSLAVLDGRELVYLLRCRGYLRGCYELSQGIGAGSRLPAAGTPAGMALTECQARRAQAGGETGAGPVEVHRHARGETLGLAIVLGGEPPAALEMILAAQSVGEPEIARLAERLVKAAGPTHKQSLAARSDSGTSAAGRGGLSSQAWRTGAG